MPTPPDLVRLLRTAAAARAAEHRGGKSDMALTVTLSRALGARGGAVRGACEVTRAFALRAASPARGDRV